MLVASVVPAPQMCPVEQPPGGAECEVASAVVLEPLPGEKGKRIGIPSIGLVSPFPTLWDALDGKPGGGEAILPCVPLTFRFGYGIIEKLPDFIQCAISGGLPCQRKPVAMPAAPPPRRSDDLYLAHRRSSGL
jgi:hypothetical protein